MKPIIAISGENLTKNFGSFTAVNNISFDVYSSEIYGLLGPNGAGKTTTVRMLTGEISPTKGKIRIFNEEFNRNSTKHKLMLGVSPQECEVNENLTAYQNLYFYGSLYELSGSKLRERCYELLKCLELENNKKKLVKNFSGGMKQRLNILIGLIHEPKIVFLDEPTRGLDPQARHKIWELIKELKKEGKTIFLTTHYMEEADALCDRIAIIDKGKIIAEGSPSKLKDSLKDRKSLEIYAKHENELINEVRKMPTVTNLFYDDEKLVISTEKPEQILPQIIKIYGERELREIKLKLPTLEDVFLELTGRSLRD
ncbi:MAG: ATP-binding cassette domain-containing protein [Candidatus Thermoplasmatota archaeon]